MAKNTLSLRDEVASSIPSRARRKWEDDLPVDGDRGAATHQTRVPDRQEECSGKAADARGVTTMSGWLIALTGCIYAYVAAELAWHGKTGLAVAYAGYAFANIGLYMAATR
jgi:hypothetical protein